MCRVCGEFAQSDPAGEKFICRVCGTKDQFGVTEIPYAFKYVKQLIATLGINVGFKLALPNEKSRQLMQGEDFNAEGREYEEIGDILQIPTGTVSTLISRAKKQLIKYMFTKLKSFTKQIDIIGYELKPTFRGENQSKTICGALLTSIIICTMIVAAVLFGKDIVFREKPVVRTNLRKDPDLSAHVEVFPFLVTLYTKFGMDITNLLGIDEEFTFVWQAINFSQTVAENGLPGISTIPFVRCTEEIIGTKAKDTFESANINWRTTKCFDKSKLGKDYQNIKQDNGDKDFALMRMQMIMCDKSTNPKCGWSFEKFGNLLVSIVTVDRFLDTSDFNDPIKLTPLFYNVSISPSLESVLKFKVVKNNLLTEDGFIFSSVREERYYTLQTDDRDFNIFNASTKLLSEVVFSMETKEVFIERQYIKIQEVIANLGGFFKVLMLIGKLLNNPNSEVSLFNSILELERNFEHKSKTDLIRFHLRPQNRVRENNDSQINLEQIKETIYEPIKLSTYLKHLFCLKFSEIAKIKERALSCIDIEDLLKTKAELKSLERKSNSNSQAENL